MNRFLRLTGNRAFDQSPKRRATVRPHLEILEDRTVPATLGPEFSPAALTDGAQIDPQVATGRDGISVIVWEHRDSTRLGNIHARIIDDSGLTPKTTDIVVAASVRNEIEPAVAMDNKNNFVVVWTYIINAGAGGGGDRNIAAAQFSATGARRNGRNFTVAAQDRWETDPDVALSGHGHIVVTYHRRNHVYARMYNDNRDFVRDISISTTSKREYGAKVARSADGRFSVAYVIDVNKGDIRLRRYNAKGDLIQRRTIAPTSGEDTSPSISMNHRGDTLVGWHYSSLEGEFVFGEEFNNAVKARMIYYTGRLGPVRTVDSGWYIDNFGSSIPSGGYGLDFPQVSLQQDGSDDRFVVTYRQSDILASFGSTNVIPHPQYAVYDYSENRLIDSGEVDVEGTHAVVNWSRNRNEAVITWVLNGDIKARTVAI